MITRVLTVLVIMAFLMTGCGTSAGGSSLGAAGGAPENRIGAMEGTALPAPTASMDQGTITREQAQTIALEHAGFAADQVSGLRTEYEIDDGVPRYEVRFRQGRWGYDYEISAETGAILSYDRDD